MIIKRILIVIIIVVSIFFTTSCREHQELRDIGIVVATGMDLEGEEILMTFEVIIPVDRVQSSEDSRSIIAQEKGKTVLEAIRNVTLSFDRKLFFSHNTVIIFGEELAKAGIGQYMDFFTRDAEPRESAYMVVAKGAKAYEVMGINDGLSDSSGEYLTDIMENSMFTLKSRSLTVNEFYRYFYARETPLLGIVEKLEILDIQSDTGVDGSRMILDAKGGAPFYKDKLIGYYTPEEMIGFNFIVDEVEEGIIVFEPDKELIDYSEVFATVGKSATFEIVKSKTKLGIEIIEGKAKLNIEVDLRGLIVEDNSGANTTLLEIKDEVEKACEEQVKDYIRMTMEKAQELRVDNLGINHIFYSTNPKEFNKVSENWNDEFSKMDYSIDVDVKIIRTGLTNTPSNIIKGDEY